MVTLTSPFRCPQPSRLLAEPAVTVSVLPRVTDLYYDNVRNLKVHSLGLNECIPVIIINSLSGLDLEHEISSIAKAAALSLENNVPCNED